MRMPVFAFALLFSLRVLADARCIAIDGDTLVWNHQRVRLMSAYAAEVYVDGKRIEQSDIGRRMGRGAQWHGERHHHSPIRRARTATREGGIVSR